MLGSDHNLYYSSNSGQSWSEMTGLPATAVTWVGGVFFNSSDMYIFAFYSGDAADSGVWKFTNGSYVTNVDRAGLGSGDGIVSFAAVNTGAALRFMVLTRAAANVASNGPSQVWGSSGMAWNVYYLDTGGSGQWVNCDGSAPSGADATSIGVGNTTGGAGTFYLFDSGGSVYKITGGTWTWSSNLFIAANTYTGYDGFDSFIAYTNVCAVNPNGNYLAG
jgi:hypothetical protein